MQYAPSVRALREFAQVVVFPKPHTQRLVTRLRQICKAERVPVANDALQYLCNASENDVRTCLNTLQFVRCVLLLVACVP